MDNHGTEFSLLFPHNEKHAVWQGTLYSLSLLLDAIGAAPWWVSFNTRHAAPVESL